MAWPAPDSVSRCSRRPWSTRTESVVRRWCRGACRRLGPSGWRTRSLAAGGHVAPVWKQYSEGIGEAGDVPVGMIIPGIPGFLNLRHPVACQVLVDAAAAAGTTVVRGVRDVTITGGTSPTVSYSTATGTHDITTTLIVGADGRSSTVRRQAGIGLERQEASGYITGLLVDGLDELPLDHDVVVGEGDVLLTLFHQGGGRARVLPDDRPHRAAPLRRVVGDRELPGVLQPVVLSVGGAGRRRDTGRPLPRPTPATTPGRTLPSPTVSS